MKPPANEWKAIRELATLAREYGELAEKHQDLAEYYSKASKSIQTAIIILSGVGTFTASLPIDSFTKTIVTSCCSATTGILSSVYVVFGLGKRGVKHDDVATGFKSLEKSIRLELLRRPEEKSNPIEIIDFCETTREKLLKQIK